MSPRNQEQLKEIRDRSRESIKSAALSLFACNGYHATSVEEIAMGANVSKGLVYNYFSGKEQILEAVIFETMEDVASEYAFIFLDLPPEEKLHRIFDTYFDLIVKDPGFWKLYWSILFNPGTPESIGIRLQEVSKPIFNQLETIFRELGYENPRAECIVLHAILDGLSVHCKLDNEVSELQQVKQVLMTHYAQAKY